MENNPTLTLYLLNSITSSYMNRWWSEALRLSIEVNGSPKLLSLNEEHIAIDTVKIADMIYADYPTIREGVNLEPGFYHVNSQTTSKMLSGWLHILDEVTAVWWVHGTGDSVVVGGAGNLDHIMPHPLVLEKSTWFGNHRYGESYAKGVTYKSIIKHI